MKHINRLLVLAFLLSLAACQREDQPVPDDALRLVRHTLYASTPEEEASSTKTVLNPLAGVKIAWSEGDEISIFSGNDSPQPYQNRRFERKNTEIVSSDSFSGEASTKDLGTYIALYPYDSGATLSDNSIHTNLLAEQTGMAGSFGKGYLVTATVTSGNSISFQHLCSGLRFQVSEEDISRVTLRGNNGEKIAGEFSFRVETDLPVSTSGKSAEEVVLIPPAGASYFTKDTWYYIVTLPCKFEKGIYMTATSASRGTGVFTLDGKVTLNRGQFKSKANLDGDMIWSNKIKNTCYGPENSFILPTGGSQTIDVSPRSIGDNWSRGSVIENAPKANEVEILWNTGSVTATLGSGQQLTINAGNSEGSALVAIKKDATILWSFLVWVTNSPTETTLPSEAKVLPALGGNNCYFQWGRKDPLIVTETNGDSPPTVLNHCTPYKVTGVGALQASIQQPSYYLYFEGNNNTHDWFTNGTEGSDPQDATLWGSGGNKTVWDPCPAGWRVPSAGDFPTLEEFDNLDNPDFPISGYLSISGSNLEQYETGLSYCWTRETNVEFANYWSSYDNGINDNGINYMGRVTAMPIRCVKIKPTP